MERSEQMQCVQYGHPNLQLWGRDLSWGGDTLGPPDIPAAPPERSHSNYVHIIHVCPCHFIPLNLLFPLSGNTLRGGGLMRLSLWGILGSWLHPLIVIPVALAAIRTRTTSSHIPLCCSLISHRHRHRHRHPCPSLSPSAPGSLCFSPKLLLLCGSRTSFHRDGN